jgi:hypothetical protein
MASTREKADGPSGPQRTEQLLTQAGERLGNLIGRTIVSFQHGMQAMRAEADQLDAPDSLSAKRPAHKQQPRKEPTNEPAMERAEELVGQAGQRAGQWMQVNGLRMRRAMAFAREELEDMWVEAQQRRHEWHSESNQSSPRPPAS